MRSVDCCASGKKRDTVKRFVPTDLHLVGRDVLKESDDIATVDGGHLNMAERVDPDLHSESAIRERDSLGRDHGCFKLGDRREAVVFHASHDVSEDPTVAVKKGSRADGTGSQSFGCRINRFASPPNCFCVAAQ